MPHSYFFCPQKTTRPETTFAASTPNVQVSNILNLSILILTLTLTLSHQFQVPIPTTANTCFDTSSVPDAFYGVGMLIWVRLIGVLYAFVHLLISLFSL